jgi:hypothetical protein
MSDFVARRVVRNATIELAASPGQVFPLFEPLGERAWADGWDPQILYPLSGAAEQGAVFSTRQHGDAPTIWAIVEFDPQRYRIRYLRVAPESHVADIRIVCNGATHTRASITYVFTGLSAAGNAYVDSFTAGHYQQWIDSWQSAINYYLEHGMLQRHSN